MAETQGSAAIRVVIVDDSVEIRDVLRLALDQQDDFTVVAEAIDGRAGVEAVSEHKPHLVLLDLSMPVMDGLQALKLIREESPGSIVIMLTGYPEDAVVLPAIELGAHGYIRKGGGVPELITQIRDVLDYRFGVTERASRLGRDVGRPSSDAQGD